MLVTLTASPKSTAPLLVVILFAPIDVVPPLLVARPASALVAPAFPLMAVVPVELNVTTLAVASELSRVLAKVILPVPASSVESVEKLTASLNVIAEFAVVIFAPTVVLPLASVVRDPSA